MVSFIDFWHFDDDLIPEKWKNLLLYWRIFQWLHLNNSTITNRCRQNDKILCFMHDFSSPRSVENKIETKRNIYAEQIQFEFIKKNGVNSIWSHICYLITSVDSCVWFYEIYENDERNSKLLKKFYGSNISLQPPWFFINFFLFCPLSAQPRLSAQLLSDSVSQPFDIVAMIKLI